MGAGLGPAQHAPLNPAPATYPWAQTQTRALSTKAGRPALRPTTRPSPRPCRQATQTPWRASAARRRRPATGAGNARLHSCRPPRRPGLLHRLGEGESVACHVKERAYVKVLRGSSPRRLIHGGSSAAAHPWRLTAAVHQWRVVHGGLSMAGRPRRLIHCNLPWRIIHGGSLWRLIHDGSSAAAHPRRVTAAEHPWRVVRGGLFDASTRTHAKKCSRPSLHMPPPTA
eukprot:293523-Chlamydomonas_euryale.AAC.4